MAENPSANVSIQDQAGGFAGGTGYAFIFACVQKNADLKARVFASSDAFQSTHGYSPAADYIAHHIDENEQPVIVVGLPTATAGAVGRLNTTGVTGTSAVTVSSGADGILEEVYFVGTVTTGGTVGTTGILVSISCDGGRTSKSVRLGTATSYTIPLFGIVLNFGAGTLLAGDTFSFTTTPPIWDTTGIAAARAACARQLKMARSIIVIGDVQTHDIAQAIVDAANSYETTNKRFVYARINVRDRLPTATKSKVLKKMRGGPNLTFAEVGATGDTITRSAGSWVDDGFAVGDVVTITGSASNNVTGPIASLTPTVLTFGTTDLAAEGPVGGVSVVGSEGLTFAEVGATGDTVTRSTGSWLADGFRVGDTVTITGTASNNVSGAIAALSATVLTFGTTDLAPEVIGSANVTITAGETMAQWVSAMDSEFAPIDAQKRIDLALGRARKASPITEWMLRRPIMWAASIREYGHDLQIPCWRKADEPLSGWTIEDTDGNVVEYDETNDGGALAARFTCARTYSNGPRGTFIALSLTRAPEDSLLSRTHNLAVVNLGCTIVQAETENAIGQVLVLKSDGTATTDSLRLVEGRVNTKLELNLLAQGKEGQRASMAVWKANTNDVLNVPNATLNGILTLELNGTLEHINTSVVIQTAGG